MFASFCAPFSSVNSGDEPEDRDAEDLAHLILRLDGAVEVFDEEGQGDGDDQSGESADDDVADAVRLHGDLGQRSFVDDLDVVHLHDLLDLILEDCGQCVRDALREDGVFVLDLDVDDVRVVGRGDGDLLAELVCRHGEAQLLDDLVQDAVRLAEDAIGVDELDVQVIVAGRQLVPVRVCAVLGAADDDRRGCLVDVVHDKPGIKADGRRGENRNQDHQRDALEDDLKNLLDRNLLFGLC